jgi:DNA-binding transcriptional LysR family regulator
MKHLKIYQAIRLIQRRGLDPQAAELLAVSPSALNRSIQAFEEAIGVNVFERIPTGVRLTSAGELLLNVVERHLIEFEDLQRQLGNLRDGDMGKIARWHRRRHRLRAAAPCDPGPRGGMPGRFSRDIFCGEVLQLLRRREVDVAIVTNPETDRSMEVLASQDVPPRRLRHPRLGRDGGAGRPVGPCARARRAAARRHRVAHRDRATLPPPRAGGRPATSVAAHRFYGRRWPGRAPASSPGRCSTARMRPRPGAASIDVGTVQISVLRLAGHPLSRPAQGLLRHLERRLNAQA